MTVAKLRGIARRMERIAQKDETRDIDATRGPATCEAIRPPMDLPPMTSLPSPSPRNFPSWNASITLR